MMVALASGEAWSRSSNSVIIFRLMEYFERISLSILGESVVAKKGSDEAALKSSDSGM